MIFARHRRQIRQDFVIWMRFNDGGKRRFVRRLGGKVFEPARRQLLYSFAGSELSTIWPNGADFARNILKAKFLSKS
jgi:hypothetical protein